MDWKDKDQVREYRRRYDATRAESQRKRALARYYANRQAMQAKARAWKSRNPERAAGLKRRWDEENREHVKSWGKKYREENAAAVSQRFRNWRLANPERMRAHANRRRAVNAESNGAYTEADIKNLWERQKGQCAYFSVCGNLLRKDGFRGVHRDHIEPLKPMDALRLPGQNTIENIQLLCQKCNNRKKNHDPYRFTQEYAGTLFPDLPTKGKAAR